MIKATPGYSDFGEPWNQWAIAIQIAKKKYK